MEINDFADSFFSVEKRVYEFDSFVQVVWKKSKHKFCWGIPWQKFPGPSGSAKKYSFWTWFLRGSFWSLCPPGPHPMNPKNHIWKIRLTKNDIHIFHRVVFWIWILRVGFGRAQRSQLIIMIIMLDHHDWSWWSSSLTWSSCSIIMIMMIKQRSQIFNIRIWLSRAINCTNCTEYTLKVKYIGFTIWKHSVQFVQFIARLSQIQMLEIWCKSGDRRILFGAAREAEVFVIDPI